MTVSAFVRSFVRSFVCCSFVRSFVGLTRSGPPTNAAVHALTHSLTHSHSALSSLTHSRSLSASTQLTHTQSLTQHSALSNRLHCASAYCVVHPSFYHNRVLYCALNGIHSFLWYSTKKHERRTIARWTIACKGFVLFVLMQYFQYIPQRQLSFVNSKHIRTDGTTW